MTLKDAQARLQAVDVKTSFIVQAPAGSGKTTLLVQRYLALLSTVQDPNEILAITFTKKAAFEMRERILSRSPELREKSTSLRIMTIDAFCRELASHLPILSRFGAAPAISDDPESLYRKACQNLFANLDQNFDLQKVLAHLDNNIPDVIGLLISTLSKRDQWLPHVLAARNEQALRQYLESALLEIQQAYVEEGLGLFSSEFAELKSLLYFAKSHAEFSSDLTDPFQLFQAASACFLTKEQIWRSSFDKRCGFPSEFQDMKTRVKALSNILQNMPGALSFLQRIAWVPEAKYSSQQWEVLQALLRILPYLVAELRLVFQDYRAVDYTEISQGALYALGEIGDPSELALLLDYRISHILMDEFQDTSIHQMRLLQKLVAGWQAGDGRTLFLVGDPMQSIYRFRYAEVALFLEAREQGIETVQLTPLVLRSNFRSSAHLVEWFNQTFSEVFPKKDDFLTGEVSYAPAEVGSSLSSDRAAVHYYGAQTREEEAARIVEIIARIPETETVGILVSARHHLRQIAQALKAARIAYQAVEMEKLAQHPLVRDLYTLTRAIAFETDRLAWLALLRSPMIGMDLEDLLFLSETESTIWQLLQDDLVVKKMSADGQQRIKARLPIFHWMMKQRGRTPLQNLAREIFQALDGEKLLSYPEEKTILESYFSLVADDMTDLAERLEKVRYTEALPANIQVMTIHQSKGLEFDHVILPGLDRTKKSINSELLRFSESARHLKFRLLLAPMTATAEEEKDPVYQYLEKMEAVKQAAESKRLLYVAATRAKQVLHLCAVVKEKPVKNSYLSDLWQGFEKFSTGPRSEVIAQKSELLPAHRLALTELSSWVQMPELINPVHTESDIIWRPKTEAMIGTVIHAWLKFLTEAETLEKGLALFNAQQAVLATQLAALGMHTKEFTSAIAQIRLAIHQTVQDSVGQWILAKHLDAHSEYALELLEGGQRKQFIIDRTFIDEAGRRVIVDYKTSDPSTAEIYRPQLLSYQKLFQQKENRSIRLMLYFPLVAKAIEW